MRWEDEQFVKVYTRDTGDWIALGWEAQSLMLLMLRKADRAGLVQSGRARVRGLAGMVGMPLEVVERAVHILLEDGCIRECDAGYLIPNYVEAQEARQSDKARKAAQRQRDRDIASAQGVKQPMVADILSARERLCGQEVTPAVTSSHAASHEVTPRRDETRRDETRRDDPPNPPMGARASSPPGQLADDICGVMRERDPRWQWTSANQGHLRLVLRASGGDEAEIVRRLRIALGTKFPTFLNLKSLADYWDAYAQPAGNGVESLSVGAPDTSQQNCAGCGATGQTGTFGESTPLGYACGCAAAWDATNQHYSLAAAWAAARRGRAA